eukprot:207935-Alexandrium_andersonii.AAC.1
MVGSPEAQVLKTKAAESWGIALFVLDVARKYGSNLHDHLALVQAGEHLARFVSVLNNGGP